MIILRNTTEEQTVYVPRNAGGMSQKRYLTADDLKTVQGESLVGAGDVEIDVPTKTSELINDSDYTDKNYVDSKLAMKADKTEVETELGKKADKTALGSYALKSEVPTKTSELTNDSGFVNTEALSGYATKEELNDKADKTALESYALKSDVPTKTSELANDSGFVDTEALGGYATKTELDDYATKAEVPNKTSELTNDSDFTTTSYVDTKVNEALGTIENKLSTI